MRLYSVSEKSSVSELHESQNSGKSGAAFSGGREPVGDGGKRPVGPEGRGQSARLNKKRFQQPGGSRVKAVSWPSVLAPIFGARMRHIAHPISIEFSGLFSNVF